MFSKGIFRIALKDMLDNIELLTKNQEELPLPLKLGQYKRKLMLSGLDRKNNEMKERGRSILNALNMYKSDIEPSLKHVDFNEFVDDPLGRKKRMDPVKIAQDRFKKFE
mmetsp:Transcript_39015/g.59379  ORF Transcript_39015/g.59379 Transcript_39015/m.59379 type:complete len:109 (-) Transcript_39015:655-981(-)|eukprot:CAMPEP_0170509110 /NCGR_PEP_ID=MMETSP0208-20121228/64391_1 /TAXON_ID=197538 /ORGANISM="Strombidium inclinatum, Strain S3" /LENGTH=108 /DNA_ID=CAMNT_0010792351 /DNA_START=3476 /DNA_END=3802 /DNA_ORIENTATION=-